MCVPHVLNVLKMRKTYTYYRSIADGGTRRNFLRDSICTIQQYNVVDLHRSIPLDSRQMLRFFRAFNGIDHARMSGTGRDRITIDLVLSRSIEIYIYIFIPVLLVG